MPLRNLVWSHSALFRSRFEKAIADCKPKNIKTSPITKFWTAYKEVGKEYDNDLASKYVGDLDNSLLFVSPFLSLAPLILLSHVPFLH